MTTEKLMSKSIGHEITLKVYVLLNEKFQRNASKVPTYFYLLEYVNTEFFFLSDNFIFPPMNAGYKCKMDHFIDGPIFHEGKIRFFHTIKQIAYNEPIKKY